MRAILLCAFVLFFPFLSAICQTQSTAPTVSYTNPSSGPVGTSVTITGSYFGATQGSSTVSFNGTLATPTSWSDTQIVAPVPSGATTGKVSATVNGIVSNGGYGPTFTVGTPPTVSYTNPASGPVGTVVTIVGQYFGATQGSSTVSFNGTLATPTSWSDTQIVAPVPSGATTGKVSATVNGIVSNGGYGPTFTVFPPPAITSISPARGGIGTTVTLAGSSFGSTQGSSAVTFNGITARIVAWSDTTIIARVPAGISPGIATAIATVNQLTSNGVQFTVTQPLFVTPNQATLTVGQTRSMQLIDENGVLITNATWSFDDPSIAEIVPPANPGDPTLLQADAVGTTNFVATYGDRTGIAKITVLPAGTAFPVGTVQWSVPPLGSFGISKTVQSLRIDENTPDLYAEDDGAYGGNGSIRALTADGQQKWIWPSTNQDKFPLLVAADDQGGAVYFANQDTPNQFQSSCYFGRVDQTGNESWQYQESNCREDYAIAPDGTIFLVEDAFQNTDTTVVTALDPLTGQVKFTVPIPGSSQVTTGADATQGLDPNRPQGLVYCTPGTPGSTVTATLAVHGSISISADGNLYIPFTKNTEFTDAEPCDSSPDPNFPNFPHLVGPNDGSWSASAALQVMIIHPDGSYSTQQLDANSASGTGMTASGTAGFFGMGRAISDGQGGALLTLSAPPALYHASSGGATKFGLPITPDAPPGDDLFGADSMLLGEDGTAYIVGSSSEEAPVDTVAAVDPNSGAVKWTASPGLHPKLSSVTSDGSLAFQYSLPDFSVHSAFASPTGQLSPLFANPDNSDAGPATAETFGLHVPSELTLGSWFAYEPDLSLSALVGRFAPMAGSERSESRGNAQNQGKPPLCHVRHCVLFVSSDLIVPPPTPPIERDVVYQLATFENNLIKPIDAPHEIILFEERIAGSARICDTPYCSNRDDSILLDHAQFKDALSVQFGSSSESWQKFFVDRGLMKVFWKQPDGTFYGAFRQNAKVTPAAVTITQDPPPGP